MITFLKGEVIHHKSFDAYNIVEVLTAGGIGYSVFVPTRMATKLQGQEIELFTHFVVREDQQSLYGFGSRSDRELFNTFLSVSGIGPKSAIAILSRYTDLELAEILGNADFKALSKVPGLGEKSAKKIILELQGKVEFNSETKADNEIISELKTALKSLGFKGDDLELMLKKGEQLKNQGVDMIEELIQSVLRAK